MSWDQTDPTHCPCCDTHGACVHQGPTRPAHVAWRLGSRAAEDHLWGTCQRGVPTPAELGHEPPQNPYAEDSDEHGWWARAWSATYARIQWQAARILSREDAERLVAANDDETLAATGDTTARAALLAALTGTDAPKPTQCGAVDMLRGTICPTCGAREKFVPGAPTGEIRRQMDAAAVEMCADCAALTGAGGGW